ncbi:MAG TPA: ATP-binding cassette domain-containing protein [Burkholderiales bacterium]|nr:ATP-binding cassette domain-containing protein [Burkholderiales bacterium]
MSAALETRGLTFEFGEFRAVDGVDLSIEAGARHALIGPNGAGKTTLVDLLTGMRAPTRGSVLLGGEDVTRVSAQQRVRRGLARTFQINSLFPRLSVLESIVAAVQERTGSAWRWWQPLAASRAEMEEAAAIAERLGLRAELGVQSQALAYGKQRLLEVALALAARPRVLLLDEPAAGIPQAESAELFEVIGRLPVEVSILFIEHDMDLVFRFARRITVLAAGRVVTQGEPAEIAANPTVRELYLGNAEPAHG